MERNDLFLGQIVCSKAGRDKGKYMVVVEKVDSEYVKVCDGQTRSIENPKKKKIKHLAKTNHILSSIHKKLEADQKISNAELKEHLNKLGYNTQIKKQEG